MILSEFYLEIIGIIRKKYEVLIIISSPPSIFFRVKLIRTPLE